MKQMDSHSSVVHVGHRPEDGARDAGRLLFGVGVPRVQVAAAAEFHDDVHLPAIIEGFHDAHNVRMIQRFENGNFVAQLLDVRVVGDQFVEWDDKLERPVSSVPVETSRLCNDTFSTRASALPLRQCSNSPPTSGSEKQVCTFCCIFCRSCML